MQEADRIPITAGGTQRERETLDRHAYLVMISFPWTNIGWHLATTGCAHIATCYTM